MSKSKQTPCVAETTGKHHCILPDSGGAAVSVSVSPLGINRLWIIPIFMSKYSATKEKCVLRSQLSLTFENLLLLLVPSILKFGY